jgi:hypothetical protein
MPKSIVANGCSFTQELYLEPEHRWTTKCDVGVNLALGGGSNERIFYTTIEYLNNHSPDVLVIGWSSIQRFTLSRGNGSSVVVTPNHTFDEYLGGDRKEFADFYYKNCHNDFVNLNRTLNYMIHLQDVCSHRHIKLRYFNALLPSMDEQSLYEIAQKAFMSREDKDTERMGIRHNLKILNDQISKLDKEIWIKEFWYSMSEHCKDFPLESGGHPDKEGSDHWAKLIKKYL